MRRLACLLALVALVGGCASPTGTGARAWTPPAARPAPPRDAAPPRNDGTLSAAEATAVLRHAALQRALSASDVYLAALHLRAVWEDSITWADRPALLELLDRYVREQSAKDFRDQNESLRLDLARAWLDRGDRERARALAATFDTAGDASARVELTAALDGPDAAERVSAAAEYPMERSELDELLARASASWGDADVAAKRIQALPADRRCLPALGFAERLHREGRADAAGWLDAAEASLAAREDDDVRGCAVEAILVAYRLGQRDRVTRILSRAKSWYLDELCVVTFETFDEVDPTLLDAPLLDGTRREAESGAQPWDGCPAVMAELAARRGDGRLARTFLRRNAADGGTMFHDDDAEGPSYAWSASVRLGRTDPFERGALGKRVFDILLLARILESRPELRVDGARLEEALELNEDEDPAVEGDVGRDDAGVGAEIGARPH